MANSVIYLKRGDTLEISGQLLNNGAPLDATGYVIRSHVRYKGALVKVLSCSFVDASLGKYQCTASADDTKSWPVFDLETDIEFTEPSPSLKVFSTDTITIRVVQDQTI